MCVYKGERERKKLLFKHENVSSLEPCQKISLGEKEVSGERDVQVVVTGTVHFLRLLSLSYIYLTRLTHTVLRTRIDSLSSVSSKFSFLPWETLIFPYCEERM